MNSNFTTLSVSVRRELAESLRKKFPKYGDISKVMRQLIQQVVDGRIKVKN